MPKLLADGREFAIRAETWDAWKQAARPFELPDDVLRRVLGIAHGGNSTGTPASPEKPDLARSDPQPATSHSGSQRPKRAAHRTAARKRSRVPSNALLPESEYELPILKALAATGGQRPAREVIREVGKSLDRKLTAIDRQPVREGKIPRWQNRTQFVRLRLVKAGQMRQDSPRGVWEIAPAGEERLARESA